ncbi:glutathione S-transferase family protein [Ideonella sp. BN130291]|uniref:glutathione S-transferase family protein n=1 Tax=Ideonella sp. BN130291 TaxID=3112940 RepID=UPI002E26C7E6|nr:glutathione S-transferase family protein [Ideonella sp. BN130291]
MHHPDPKLYGLSRSVYTRIARLALLEKGVPHELEEVEIFGPSGVPASHLLRHPFGRIPVLDHAGFMLFETSAITRYVDEAFAGPALQPASAPARARMNQIIGLLDAYAYRPMVWQVFVERVRVPLEGGVSDEAKILAGLAASKTCLQVLQGLMSGPYLAGEHATLADWHAMPMLQYLSLASEGAELLSQYPAVCRWLETLRRRPSVQQTQTAYERSVLQPSA